MVGLLDIAPGRETVSVGGRELEVMAISLDQIVVLMQRFGNVFDVLTGGAGPEAVAALRPLFGAVIAAGCGELGNPKAEAHAAGFAIGDQAAIIAAIRRLTMPKGVRPFLLDLTALGLPLDGVLASFDQVGASLQSSPPPSTSSSDSATSAST